MEKVYNGARAAECAFCSSLIIGISPIEPNAKFPLRVNLKDGVQGHSFERMYKGARELNGVQKCSVCCRRVSGQVAGARGKWR